jgi:hypothetical protein
MTLLDSIKAFGEASRPYGVAFLCTCLGVSLFFPATSNAAQVTVAGVIGLFFGGKSWENTVTTKAASTDKQTEAGAVVTTPPAAVTTIEPPAPAKKGKK